MQKIYLLFIQTIYLFKRFDNIYTIAFFIEKQDEQRMLNSEKF